MKLRTLETDKKFLITGAAGFIGFHLARRLLEMGLVVIGFDNLNDYYEVSLKMARLSILADYPNFKFIKGDLANATDVKTMFSADLPHIVINLGAQAGVRYSLENPEVYLQSNLTGFLNILEACRQHSIEHLVYASSSSVYGANKKVPFSTDDKVDKPVSIYAATKKSNELMAYTYSHLFAIPTTGLRFFTVYGPFGRPDMAYYSFTRAIFEQKPIKIYNQGDMYRDFTYIDDIITGLVNVIPNPPYPDEDGVPYRIYNIGNHRPEKLMDFIATLEACIGREAIKDFYPMQPGDVYQTYADVTDLRNDFGFSPDTPIQVGLQKFVEWYRDYYKV